MKKALFTFLFLFSLFSSNVFAQQDAKQETARLMDLLNKLEGSYQVQIVDSRELPAIPLSLMDTIVAKRDENITTYVWLKSNTRVKILSLKEIQSPNYKGLKRIEYISSSDLN